MGQKLESYGQALGRGHEWKASGGSFRVWPVGAMKEALSLGRKAEKRSALGIQTELVSAHQFMNLLDLYTVPQHCFTILLYCFSNKQFPALN